MLHQLALTTYPGFPCETTDDDIDLAAGIHGQCWDATSGNQQAGDVLPVSEMPEDRPIVVVFSQPMKLSSIRSEETFVVEKVNVDKTPIETVSGRLEKNDQRVRFFPDQPWEPDSFYRYTMKADRGTPDCDQENPTSICGVNELALKADLLEGLNRGGSGDNCLEPFDHEGSDADGWAPSANSTKLAVVDNKAGVFDARVGCKTNQTCPKNKFIYQTYALNTEVVGPGTYEGEDAILVNLYPALLATSSVSVFVNVLTLQEESITNTQVIRMRYAEDPSCEGTAGCARNQLIPGAIVEGDKGQPVFKTNAELMLDAPDMVIPLGGTHDLYAREFYFDLEGDIPSSTMAACRLNSEIRIWSILL